MKAVILIGLAFLGGYALTAGILGYFAWTFTLMGPVDIGKVLSLIAFMSPFGGAMGAVAMGFVLSDNSGGNGGSKKGAW